MMYPTVKASKKGRSHTRGSGSYLRAPQFGHRRVPDQSQASLDMAVETTIPEEPVERRARHKPSDRKIERRSSRTSEQRILTPVGNLQQQLPGAARNGGAHRPKSIAAGEVKVVTKRRRLARPEGNGEVQPS